MCGEEEFEAPFHFLGGVTGLRSSQDLRSLEFRKLGKFRHCEPHLKPRGLSALRHYANTELSGFTFFASGSFLEHLIHCTEGINL
jgi:hypothetical protein